MAALLRLHLPTTRVGTEVVRYGYAVKMAWIRQGAIFGKCRERGVGLPELSTVSPSAVKWGYCRK
jgi:hypothetical protein